MQSNVYLCKKRENNICLVLVYLQNVSEKIQKKPIKVVASGKKNWLLKDHKWEKEFSKINKQKINNGERTVCLYNWMPNKNMFPMAIKRIRTTQCPQIW